VRSPGATLPLFGQPPQDAGMLMKLFAGLLVAMICAGTVPSSAQIKRFEHIVVIVQENRTPDNLFYALCSTKRCSTKPDDTEYDIQTKDWLDKNASGGKIQPTPVPLANWYDPRHQHNDFVAMCDLDKTTDSCRMDGAGDISCKVACPPNAEFKYVDNISGILDPYLFLATHYGWANYMFQTNQGPSFPAHQFLFGATSAPSLTDDHEGTFAADNLYIHGAQIDQNNGCISSPSSRIQLINANGVENKKNRIYPCFEHLTLADVLDSQSVSWRYYTPGPGDLWSAPDAIRHICEPNNSQCTGPMWRNNLALSPPEVLADVGVCNLRGVSWVIPSAQFSDHAGSNRGLGPAWVAAVVNAIGNSKCRNADGSSYWDSTAIVITWDDWGGWYDHEPPTFLPSPEGGYQYGFRVPLIFASAYTRKAYISNSPEDFGSIARFIEYNFDVLMGALTFADARSEHNLAEFYALAMPARKFVTIPAPNLPSAIRSGTLKLEPPDDD
jgi:phospholipase C